MKILLHCCCAPCTLYPVEKLKEENFEIALFWFNPNIHPYKEYNLRMANLSYLSQKLNTPVIYKDEYNLEEFLSGILKNIYSNKKRCEFCYYYRLNETASIAKENNFEFFSTTILYSPYQDHNLVKEIAEDLSDKYRIKFYYEDFRVGYKKGVEESKKLKLYRQNYCGCIFSEKEKYIK
jgi:predicted adenine nucleotide alpha hydrolase (AANH) superfamily ATPase